MMSLVQLSQPDQVEKKDGILRIWLDKEQAQRHFSSRFIMAALVSPANLIGNKKY